MAERAQSVSLVRAYWRNRMRRFEVLWITQTKRAEQIQRELNAAHAEINRLKCDPNSLELQRLRVLHRNWQYLIREKRVKVMMDGLTNGPEVVKALQDETLKAIGYNV